MLSPLSIKDLYPLALAEGEGMGTAYEYYVKRMALSGFLAGRPRPRSILIAGLPQKYGASLDFMLLATELGAAVTVVDDRAAALERLRGALDALERLGDAPPVNRPTAVVLADLETLSPVSGPFDLILSSEVLQRLTAATRTSYVAHLRDMSPALALFCPNANNEAHNNRSGLGGLSLAEMVKLTRDDRPQTTGGGGPSSCGYIDMPPFPPGITRTAEQRDEATSGRFEAFVMWSLGIYARAERFVPAAVHRRQSHIVYAFIDG